MEFKSLAGTAGEWLKGTGPESDIVISTRVRLARNLADFPFLTRTTPGQRKEIEDILRREIRASGSMPKDLYYPLEVSPPLDLQFLVERHLISKDLATSAGARGVAFTERETVSIMVNEEDHLRIQVLKSGLQIQQAWEQIDRIDDMIEKRVDYAFSSHAGYLTVCPTNVGTGLRVSVMMHLPALVITKQIEKVFYAVSKINLAVRGLYGEGTQASGNFFQISNQITLGKSEEQVTANIESAIPQIIRFERSAREALLGQSRVKLEDKVCRAQGLLRSARVITSEEVMDRLSDIRLGVNMGLLKEPSVKTINEMFILTQPAHLQKLEGRELNSLQRDTARADLIRQKLGDK